MKKIICVPFAYIDKMNSGVNISTRKEKIIVYLQNAVVALCSAKHFNKDCDVALITNLTLEQIPKEICKIFLDNEIQILNIPFDRYCFSSDYKWALAFYKLCALSYLIKREWEYVCYMDTDVYIQNSFDAVWRECDDHILLYDVNHGLNTQEYVAINDEFTRFLGRNQLPTHYGGEFFAANKKNATYFEAETLKVYETMKKQGFVTAKGDEFIVSLAANKMKNKIKNASPYIHRFWTGGNFRLTSTCYEYNPVIVLHLPAEKEKGIVELYKRYFAKGKFPENKNVWKICRLSRQPIYEKIGRWGIKILKKI